MVHILLAGRSHSSRLRRKSMHTHSPRIIISALRGGSGKTIFSLGLIALWKKEGRKIAAFKKGPDFIDAGWLSFASGSDCRNLDPFLMEPGQILKSYKLHSEGAVLSVIEGNRGLYDGLDLEGRCSTAELGKLLKAPVILVVDVTMATRTVAAVVKGCQVFDPDLLLEGVILNRVAGSRQEDLVRKAIERYCGVKVVGSVPKLKDNPFPERHMGLVPYHEREHSERAVSWAKAVAKKYIETEEIGAIARRAPDLGNEDCNRAIRRKQAAKIDAPGVRIGFVRDKSFWFYYPENLEQLSEMGAELVEMDALRDAELRAVDALYIGGGFPETQAEALAANESFRTALKEAIQGGLPVYAECGGFMYLGESLMLDGERYPMVGALPVRFVLHDKPQGHGYTILKAVQDSPYYTRGDTVRGHEFHYSEPIITREEGTSMVFRVVRGHGLDGRRDGMVRKNLLATYSHVHAGGRSSWARSLFAAALARRHRGFGKKK